MSRSPRTNWLAVMAATLGGFGLMFAPREQTDRAKALVHDGALPGLRVLHNTQTWAMTLPTTFERLTAASLTPDGDTEEVSVASAATIASLETEVRRLQAQNAQLLTERDQSQTQSGSPFVAESGTPLFVPELINATVVAANDVSVAVQRASAQRIVDVGHTSGVVPADFVVSAQKTEENSQPRLLIDQGEEVGLHADQQVFAGRCVVGKIQQVGRWTSSILPITDAEFRGRAQLMRRSADGLVVGAEGIIGGNGESDCRLMFIGATEPVAIGDEVYTASAGTSLPMPMYYGRVTAADLPSGSPYWEITVTPVETMNNARSVQVLRVVLNPSRTNLSGLPEGSP